MPRSQFWRLKWYEWKLNWPKQRNDPSATVQRHIRLLHEYNKIKDIGQGLMGLIADARGVRQIEVQKEYGVGDRD
ncbi:DNA repair protein, Swi5 [Aspergillus oryzae]|uniref:DNA repair protein, Swi5 n=1 Tax=Aspergillus oryzae TaxID=5062 RepID=A0A1S9D4K2_ASPOZ|nr:uncharacterized protein G4B84_000546 [Aspergillus flavus NRRL3357]OOO03989.1 DNA repair protein, Swi5 [Aspergillus oryzae]QMW25301.1 hypothetical protein G4B84_000546 [Aspergillus flavus NRRL3357]QMW37363.1 hypothetical protein G4B11_000599 [Aspergillus flavus]